MVEAIEDRLHRTRHVGEVADPTGLLPDGPLDLHPHPEGVSVETGALVTWRHVREEVRGLERELLEDLHHRTPAELARGCGAVVDRKRFMAGRCTGK